MNKPLEHLHYYKKQSNNTANATYIGSSDYIIPYIISSYNNDGNDGDIGIPLVRINNGEFCIIDLGFL